MRKYSIFFILVYLLLVPFSYSLAASTTGFIPGQIWYSKDSFAEGETVKIFTALWNNTAYPLSAKVEFYDKNVILGSRDIAVSSESLKDVSISWKVTSGDHSISAKIISSSLNASGKKENIAISNSVTEVDKRFIPIVINTIDGKPATGGDIVQSQIDKATSSLDGIVPEAIITPVNQNVGALDSFRADTFKNISNSKLLTQEKIDSLNKLEVPASSNVASNKKSNEKVVPTTNKVGISDATEKPISYLKLFFLTVLAFVFGSKLVFYSLIILIVFFVVRGIYRKIRNR